MAEDNPVFDAQTLGPGLKTIRLRRKYFFGVILVYIPALWATQQLSPTNRSMAIVFIIWLAALIVFMLLSAIARCPRCGNYFHVNGMTLLYLRKCLHCQLHINADKTA